MEARVVPTSSKAVVYPDSDGQPMADNTEQFSWIQRIHGNLDALLPTDFVAGDLLWYPVEGHPEIRAAPDVMVILGRPKGRRGSYRQWEEEGVAPKVVFEIWSPGNTFAEGVKKLSFYDRYGVQEFYTYDPDRKQFCGWIRQAGGSLEVVYTDEGWTSPLLKVHFEQVAGELVVRRPDGKPFLTPAEMLAEAEAATARAEEAEARVAAEAQRAEAEAQRAEVERQRAERLAAKLRALGIEE